mgnify:CR=1 FL=1
MLLKIVDKDETNTDWFRDIVIKEGDVLTCTANTEHWHASSKEQDVTYLAIYKGETEWTEVLTQEAYDKVSGLLDNN